MKSFLSARKKKAILSAIAAGMCASGLLMPQKAEARLQKGAHDKDLLASAMLRKVW